MNPLPLIIATTQTTHHWLSVVADWGTVFAGIAAAVALGIDIYNRTLGKKPHLTPYIDGIKKDDTAHFYLAIQNIGTAPAILSEITTQPEWSKFDGIIHTSTLKLVAGHILQPDQTLKIPLDTSTLIQTLHDYHANEPKEPFMLHISLTYRHQTRTIQRPPKPKHYPINLTSSFMAEHSLYSIIPDDEAINLFLSLYN